MELFLQNKPNEVVAKATDVQTMLSQAESTQPDVILPDWELCDRPLDDLITALHLLERQPAVIFIKGTYESKQAALAAGADAFVLKGDPPEELLITLRRVHAQHNPSRTVEF